MSDEPRETEEQRTISRPALADAIAERIANRENEAWIRGRERLLDRSELRACVLEVLAEAGVRLVRLP